MTDDYARPRSMADAVVEQATAAPGETREAPRDNVARAVAELRAFGPDAWAVRSADAAHSRIGNLVRAVLRAYPA